MGDRIRLNYQQLNYVVEKTGIKDAKDAIEYFAYLMVQEKVHPSRMAEYVQIMIDNERKLK